MLGDFRRVAERTPGGPVAAGAALDQAGAARGEIVAGVDLLHDTRVFGPLGRPGRDRGRARGEACPSSARGSCRSVAAGTVPALATGLAAGVVALLALGLPRMAEALWQRFSDPFGDHPPYSAVRFRVEPGDLRVVYGQGVEIRAIVEGAPVDRLDLVLEPAGAAPERVPMFQEGSGRWRAAVANVTAPAATS